MKNNALILGSAAGLLWLLGQSVQAADTLRDPQTDKIEVLKQTNQPTDEDRLRKQKLSATPTDAQDPQAQDGYLLAHPRELEKLFAFHLATNQKSQLPRLAALYKQVADRDESLLEWAEAALTAEQNLNRAIRLYRVLVGKFPKNDFIRFQLATILFYNQEFDAAKNQFERLRSSPNVKAEDIKLFDEFLQAIAARDKWNFSFGTTYLHDKNLTNMAPQGTQILLPNGGVITQNSPAEKGSGLNLNLGLDRQWSLQNGRFFGVESSLSHKYYWDNKKFNELSAYFGTAYGYNDARFSLKVMPYLLKRWYSGGGSRDSHALKPYVDTYGFALSGSYWLTPSLKYSANYNFGYESYRNNSHLYNGPGHSFSQTLMYLNGPKQYWGGGVDWNQRNAADRTNAYRRIGMRLFWGQEWPLGFASNAGIGVAKRTYREQEAWHPQLQRNKEYSANVSLWHKAVHFGGFTPRLTWSYQKTKSNVPIYTYNKKQVFIEIEKNF